MSRVPNRCWITQTRDSGDPKFHRENRVLAKGDDRRREYGNGETYCGLPLEDDRRRMTNLPTHRSTDVCRRCQQDYLNLELRFHS